MKNSILAYPTDFFVNTPGLFCWVKDTNSHYLHVNDLYAKYAGYSCRTAMLGKSDYQTTWCSLAEEFRKGDRIVCNNYIDFLSRYSKPGEMLTSGMNNAVERRSNNEIDIFQLSTNSPPKEVQITCNEFPFVVNGELLGVWGFGQINDTSVEIKTVSFSDRAKIKGNCIELPGVYSAVSISRDECKILMAFRLTTTNKEAVQWLDDLYDIRLTTRQIRSIKSRIYERMHRSIQYIAASSSFSEIDILHELNAMGFFAVLDSSPHFLVDAE